MQDAKGFLDALFDFSFSHYVATKLISALYKFLVGVYAFIAVAAIAAAASNGFGAALAGLIVSVVLFFLYTIVTRIGLELIAVLFRAAEHQRETAEHTKGLVGAWVSGSPDLLGDT